MVHQRGSNWRKKKEARSASRAQMLLPKMAALVAHRHAQTCYQVLVRILCLFMGTGRNFHLFMEDIQYQLDPENWILV